MRASRSGRWSSFKSLCCGDICERIAVQIRALYGFWSTFLCCAESSRGNIFKFGRTCPLKLGFVYFKTYSFDIICWIICIGWNRWRNFGSHRVALSLVCTWGKIIWTTSIAYRHFSRSISITGKFILSTEFMVWIVLVGILDEILSVIVTHFSLDRTSASKTLFGQESYWVIFQVFASYTA